VTREDSPAPSLPLVVLGVALATVGVAGAVVLPGEELAPAALLAGATAIVVGIRGLVRRAGTDTGGADTASVETGARAPTPGEGLDRALGTFEDEGAAYLAYPNRVRSAIESATVEVLGRYRGIPPEEARNRIREGSWTDDRTATTFLGDGSAETPETGPLARLRQSVGSESEFRQGIRHAVAALGEVSGADTGGPATMAAGFEARDDGGAGTPRTDGGSAGEVVGTGKWTGTGAVATLCAGVGVVVGAPAVVLAGGVVLGVAAYSRGSRSPDAELVVERTVETTDPAPGERVRVTVTVENAGNRAIADLRIVDGVPEALPVVEGSPRVGTALRPGGETTISYVLEARRGVHEFDSLRAIVRDLPGGAECEHRVTAEGDEPMAVTCVPSLNDPPESVPIDGAAAGYAGRIATDEAGDGLEFHAVREYQPSDPLGRVDWKRYARTGELAAREYRDERATTAVIVVDARAPAYLASGPDAVHAVDRAVEAARRAFVDLEREGNRVGIAALGREECWLRPGTGAAHRARARDLLATHPALSSSRHDAESDPDDPTAWLRSRLPDDAQVVFVSPVCDDGAADAVRRLRAHGYPVTAVSPDPTASATPSQALARVGRRLRLARLRDVGCRVVDWRESEPLAGALRRSVVR
jgi:uncharacterized repeat protein (TIGR01451 family)